MSDPEDDREFLDEIKALEDVLAQEESSTSRIVDNDVSTRNVHAGRRGNIPSRGFGQVEQQPERIGTYDNDNLYSAYETNRKLIDLLRETKRELLTILERCVENKTIINEKIRIRAKSAKSTKLLVCTAGMPYFKDAKHYPAPLNDDARTKKRKGELQVMQLRYTCPWTAKDRNILWRAIRQQAAAVVLESANLDATDPALVNFGNDVGGEEEEEESGEVARAGTSSGGIAARLNLPKNFRSMIGPLGAREFDWLRIAASDFDDRHTADECRVMWRVFLHPDVNRYKWSREEDAGIDRLSEKYEMQDWDEVARELNSGRSGYQCFIRYNSINRASRSDESAWSSKEDARLRRCVEKFRIGHYVPWGTVARYMGFRSKGQVYYRWMYNASPHLKKGRFTEDEDELLTRAVRMYGKNFCKISTSVITNRSSVQLSDHYHTLAMRKRGMQNYWSINEDARLLILYNKHGADWSRIARSIIGKTRTQLRHRHKAIVRYWDRGISLYEIPRDLKRNFSDHANDDEAVTEACDNELIDRLERERSEKNRSKRTSDIEPIDRELIKYFQLVPGTSKPGRKRKYYENDELEDMTRKLCIILKALGANLEIPTELEEMAVTEKDKQLAKSLNDYQNLQSEYAKFPTRDVRYGAVVCNDDEADENEEKHFAPLCRGDCNRMEKLRWHEKIDYEPPATLQHCQLALNMKLNTPETIVELVGEDGNMEFERLGKILISGKIESRQFNITERIYASEVPLCAKILPSIETEASSRDSGSFEIQERNSASCSKKKRGTKREKSWSSSTSEGIIQCLDQPFSCIEPNYYTLLGLQHIVSKAKISFEPDRKEEVYSSEGKKSMAILKKRLIQLFKYPIGLSHILRPEVYVGRNVQSMEIKNDDASNDEDIADGCSKKIVASDLKKTRL